jgi:CheY-like chemotaxis protein
VDSLSKSVLLLDENTDVLAFLTQLLETRGIRVLRARSKSEALEILGRGYVSADLVLANLTVARMDQAGLTREIGSIRRRLPVIFMSAFVDSGVIRVEVMNRVETVGFPGVDERGVIEAVLSALRNSAARALEM